MKAEREERIRKAAFFRQPDLAVVLDNVHDTHNLSAVLRSCDAVGIPELFIIDTNPDHPVNQIKLGKRSSAGARKWVDVHLFRDTDKALEKIRSKYDRILIADHTQSSSGLYSLDLTTPTALVFGNEHRGISMQMRDAGDGAFAIPMFGMVESLNISVACAVTLFEAMRQRMSAGLYDPGVPGFKETREGLFRTYHERHSAGDILKFLVRPTGKD